MKIRSITTFINPQYSFDHASLKATGDFNQAARSAFEAAGYQVQTTRLAMTPFPELFPGLAPDAIIAAAQELETAAGELGFSYLALGPALIDHPESYALIPDLIAATETVFCCAQMATTAQGISLPAVRACAQIIHDLAPQDPNGFANLYFTAIANVGPGSPFFPGAYHHGDQPQFALAVEAAPLAVEAFTQAESLEQGAQNLTAAIERHAQTLSAAAEPLAAQFGIPFGGIDFSLAPFPEPASSTGAALEAVGIPAAGLHGSLAAAAILADAIDQAAFKRTGLSGLMLPLLEDATLAARAAEGYLGLKDLLMYSAVCGTGLDTIPLPGDTTPEQLVPVLLDLSALALRLDKPLSARLMPIPGKKAGEATTFEFDFFANSRVLSLESQPVGKLLGQDAAIKLGSRKVK